MIMSVQQGYWVSMVGGTVEYSKPELKVLGNISDHTFTNTGQVPGVGPKGKNRNHPEYELDKFSEPSHS
jgi:hypothetical protein